MRSLRAECRRHSARRLLIRECAAGAQKPVYWIIKTRRKVHHMIHTTLKRVCAAIVWSWLAASFLHGVSHLAVGAPLSPLPPSLLGLGVGVELFFSLGPLVALWLLYTGWMRGGAWLLVLTMFIALLWGFGGHFLFPGGDNIIAHMSSPGGPAFLLTSLLVLLLRGLASSPGSMHFWRPGASLRAPALPGEETSRGARRRRCRMQEGSDEYSYHHPLML